MQEYCDHEISLQEAQLATGLGTTQMYAHAANYRSSEILYQGRDRLNRDYQLSHDAYERLFSLAVLEKGNRTSVLDKKFHSEVLKEINSELSAQQKKTLPLTYKLSKQFLNTTRKACCLSRVKPQKANSSRIRATSSIRNLVSVYAALACCTKRTLPNGSVKIVHPLLRINFDAYTVVFEPSVKALNPLQNGLKVFKVRLDAKDGELGEELPHADAVRIVRDMPITIHADAKLPIALKILVASNATGRVGPVLLVAADSALPADELKHEKIPVPQLTADLRMAVAKSRAGNKALWDLWFTMVGDWLDTLAGHARDLSVYLPESKYDT